MLIPLYDKKRTRKRPWVNYSLIAANVLVFVYEMALGKQAFAAFIHNWGVVPDRLFGAYDYQTLLTSMFLHGGLWHIGGNMLFLWIFGDNVEERLGRLRYLLLYLIAGAAGALLHALLNANSTIPMVGASGAISGVLGAYVLFFPRVKVMTLIPVFFFLQLIALPAWVYLAIWMGFQLLMWLFGLAGGGTAGVAWLAHIGGFGAGVVLALVLCGFRIRRGSVRVE